LVRVSYTNSSTISKGISFGQDAGQAASSARSGAQPSRLRFMKFSRAVNGVGTALKGKFNDINTAVTTGQAP